MCSAIPLCCRQLRPTQLQTASGIIMAVTGRGSKRYYRTTVLGIVAMGALIWVAVEQFQIAPQEVAELALATVLLVFLVIAAAAGMALIWVGLRKLLRRRGP